MRIVSLVDPMTNTTIKDICYLMNIIKTTGNKGNKTAPPSMFELLRDVCSGPKHVNIEI